MRGTVGVFDVVTNTVRRRRPGRSGSSSDFSVSSPHFSPFVSFFRVIRLNLCNSRIFPPYSPTTLFSPWSSNSQFPIRNLQFAICNSQLSVRSFLWNDAIFHPAGGLVQWMRARSTLAVSQGRALSCLCKSRGSSRLFGASRIGSYTSLTPERTAPWEQC